MSNVVPISNSLMTSFLLAIGTQQAVQMTGIGS